MGNQAYKKELLREFRSAHRLINEFQGKIQELLLNYIQPKLGFIPKLVARRLYCDPISQTISDKGLGNPSFRILEGNWAYDLLYTQSIEYFLGEKDNFGFAVIQISDTGAYHDNQIHQFSTDFPSAEECESLLVFKIKYKGNQERDDWMHTNDRDTSRIYEVINSKSDVLIPKDSPTSCYIRFSLMNFMDEKSCEEAIEKVNTQFEEFKHGFHHAI